MLEICPQKYLKIFTKIFPVTRMMETCPQEHLQIFTVTHVLETWPQRSQSSVQPPASSSGIRQHDQRISWETKILKILNKSE